MFSLDTAPTWADVILRLTFDGPRSLEQTARGEYGRVFRPAEMDNREIPFPCCRFARFEVRPRGRMREFFGRWSEIRQGERTE